MTGQNRNKDIDSDHELPSGPWKGYFIDPRPYPGHPAGDKWPMDIIMEIKYGGKSFWAFGMDDVGTFICNGTISGSTMKFHKRYQHHEIIYEGEILDLSVEGTWRLYGDQGTFALEAVHPEPALH